MKIFSKITALALSVILGVGALTACETEPPVEIPSGPDTSYVVAVKVKYATTDSKMNQAVGYMNTSSTVSVDGDRASVITESTSGDSTVSESYVLDGGQLYHTTKVGIGQFELCENEVATVDKVDIAVILNKIGAGANIGLDDFDTVNNQGNDKNAYYTCSDIKEESAKSLLEIYGKSLTGIGASVTLESAAYYLEESDGQVKYSILSCSFSVILEGKTYKVTMHMESTYDYEAEPNIVVPDNADSFTKVGYNDIIK